MGRIILTRGLPGSGKTTAAKAWVANDPENRRRVSRDDLREMMFGESGVLDRRKEQAITEAEDHLVRDSLSRGKDVIVDAMHLRRRYVTRWERMGEVELVEFPVPLAELEGRSLRRHKQGERTVDVGVVHKIAKRFGIKADGELPVIELDERRQVDRDQKWAPAPEYSYIKDDAYIVDIDGTLADLGDPMHRDPYDESKVYEDGIHNDVVRLVDGLSRDYHIIAVSGRSDGCVADTARWLVDKAQLSVDELHMRKTGDGRGDDVVKAEIFDNQIASKYNVLGVIDDRPKVLRMWRAKGLTTFAVGDTDREF
ncbi:MAG: AAA family ATPase [Microbacterium gubbeenense]|uniref:phosphatase domain-containing protein n=1 Tax=Microbacterium gubbeenense TaxID=159896 RepID=UPI003F9712D6